MTRFLRYDALALADARGVQHPSILLALEQPSTLGHWAPANPDVPRGRLRVLAVDQPHALDRHPLAARATRIARPGAILLPALVNAHTHLDLTHMGPQRPPHAPPGAPVNFGDFAQLVIAQRHADPDQITSSVRAGVARCLEAGVVAVGDISGAVRGRPCAHAARALRESPLAGIAAIEFFGTSPDPSGITALLRREVEGLLSDGVVGSGVRVGLSPHAPGTVALAGYRAAMGLARDLALPIVTHLAETPAEHEMIAHARGPQRTFLESRGLWPTEHEWGRGLSPVAHLAEVLRAARPLCAHVHDCSDADLQILADARPAGVVYCPRGAAYFGSADSFGPHRYREMMDRGVVVALGTDSVINLPTAGISVWEEARLLYERDGLGALRALAMVTTHGALALGLDPGAFIIEPGKSLAGLIAVPMDARGVPEDVRGGGGNSERVVALALRGTPELLACGNLCG